MIRLVTVIETYEADLLAQYRHRLTPEHRHALAAMQRCRTQASPKLQVACTGCAHQLLVPHSCGHRHCPHCQHHESQQWLERQLQKQVPAEYFLLTFTLPAEFRPLSMAHQGVVYDLLLRASWETLRTFSQNDPQLQGTPGAIAVLHTNTRRLEYHPHVHIVMPAAAIKAAGLALPARHPTKWVVDCKSVGTGQKALVYLGRYLYRGVIREQDILACRDGQVTFRYRDAKTGKRERRTVSGADFLWLVLQHVLPKRFRRARNFGFLHPNCKRLIALLHLVLKFAPAPVGTWVKVRPPVLCPCCGAAMVIVKTGLRARFDGPMAVPRAAGDIC